jgi:hypothetical protein
VPGIGTMSKPWASTQAMATCAGVAPASSATSRTAATIPAFASSAWKRGLIRRKSFSANCSAESTVPVRNPRPSGA